MTGDIFHSSVSSLSTKGTWRELLKVNWNRLYNPQIFIKLVNSRYCPISAGDIKGKHRTSSKSEYQWRYSVKRILRDNCGRSGSGISLLLNGGSEWESNPSATPSDATRRFWRSPKVFWSVMKILYYNWFCKSLTRSRSDAFWSNLIHSEHRTITFLSRSGSDRIRKPVELTPQC